MICIGSKKNSIGKSTLLLLVTFEATDEQQENTLCTFILTVIKYRD
jgi:hypothetical protein